MSKMIALTLLLFIKNSNCWNFLSNISLPLLMSSCLSFSSCASRFASCFSRSVLIRDSSSCISFDTLSSSMLAGGGEESGVGSDLTLVTEEALILQDADLRCLRPKARNVTIDRNSRKTPGTRRWRWCTGASKKRAKIDRGRHFATRNHALSLIELAIEFTLFCEHT